MKTGLLTFYHIHHYGAMLQAYATERAVESLGSECEIIDYYVNQDNALFQRPSGLGSAAHDAHTALHYGPLKKRHERFEAFSRDHLRISDHHYESLEELRSALAEYDVVISIELPAEVLTSGADDDAGLVLSEIAPLVDRNIAVYKDSRHSFTRHFDPKQMEELVEA